MISKNLCFKLMREDLKRRIWNIALLFLVLFFALVIPVVYIGGTPMNGSMDVDRWLTMVTNWILQILGYRSFFMAFIVLMSALVVGISGFSYLHSPKKVDFYHSVPVRREQLFLTSYLNGILMMAVLYLLNLVIAVVATSSFGVEFSVVYAAAIKAYFFHMSFYCLLYTTVVVAMILTGNIIIALMGTAVFFAYGPALVALGVGYMSAWFRTYHVSESVSNLLEKFTRISSPLGYYLGNVSTYMGESVVKVILTAILVSVVFAIGACLLYRLRPSESAGKAMAFSISMTPIKILLVMPVALAFSLFFYVQRESFGWAVFGVLCGAFITHSLMEIIYHFDFGKLFFHKIHLVICMAAGLLILCGFKYDWFDYNDYLPKDDQVKRASVYVVGLDNWITYGSLTQLEGEDTYRWIYGNEEEYVLEHMELSEPSDAIFMAEQGILYNKSGDWSNDIYNVGSDVFRYVVQYTLNSGRKVRRSYSAKRTALGDVWERIYDSEEYKTGVYPILLQKPEDIAGINVQQFDEIRPLSQDIDIDVFLATYQEELKSLTLKTSEEEFPIGKVQFVTMDIDRALQAGAESQSDGYNLMRRIKEYGYYPIYPSFTKTVQLLKEAGVSVMEGLSGEDISQVEIRDYSAKDDMDDIEIYKEDYEKYYNLVDKDELDTLKSALIYREYYDMNYFAADYCMKYVDATVTMSNGDRIRVYLDRRKVPEFLMKRLEDGRQSG